MPDLFDQLSDLPSELVLRIFTSLTPSDVLVCRQLSKHFNRISKDTQLWENLLRNHLQANISSPSFDPRNISRRDMERMALGPNGPSISASDSTTPIQSSQGMPMLVIKGPDLKDLNHVRMVLGGQFLVALHYDPVTLGAAYFKVWELPEPNSASSSPAQARLIATTKILNSTLIYTSVFFHPTEPNVRLQLNALTTQGVEIFDVVHHAEAAVETIVPRQLAPVFNINPNIQDVSASPNGRFLWWSLPQDSEDDVFGIFDVQLATTRHVRLQGLQSTPGAVSSLHAIANDTTLVVFVQGDWEGEHGQIILFPLPLLRSDEEEEPITVVAETARYDLNVLNYPVSDRWREGIHVVGEAFVLVCMQRLDSDTLAEQHIHLFEVADTNLIYRGQAANRFLLQPGDAVPLSYSVGQSSIHSFGSSRVLRMVWSRRWYASVSILSIWLDSASHQPKNATLRIIERGLFIPYSAACRPLTSTCAFSERSAHILCRGGPSYIGPVRLARYDKEVLVYESEQWCSKE
ncbi:hypothetical protein DL96DRAFT_1627986 [Flagelloscypha sp. PMI_526]|nr:hypothetical protein DL96DRAFT_1627986 [Flagelloscypha sp. PMI_526]